MAVAKYEMHNGSPPVPGTSDTNTRCPRRHERVTHFECLAPPVVTHASWETCICSRWKNFQYSAIFSRNKKSHLLKTKKPLAATASAVSAIVSAEFVSPTKVKLTYLSGSDFKEVTEVLTLNSTTVK